MFALKDKHLHLLLSYRCFFSRWRVRVLPLLLGAINIPVDLGISNVERPFDLSAQFLLKVVISSPASPKEKMIKIGKEQK